MELEPRQAFFLIIGVSLVAVLGGLILIAGVANLGHRASWWRMRRQDLIDNLGIEISLAASGSAFVGGCVAAIMWLAPHLE